MLVEYVVKRAPYRMKVENLFNESFKGNIKLYTTLMALSETLYIISKIYFRKINDLKNLLNFF